MAWVSALFTIAIHSMRTMIPLRGLSVAANCVFIAYGAAAQVLPLLFLHAVLLPLNSYRLWQMLKLTRRVREASQGDPSMAWLKPFSSRRHARAGKVVFIRGDAADRMYYVT